MNVTIHLRGRRVLLIAGALVLIGGAGVAYAAIPSGGVFTGCVQNTNGAVRLIDPSSGSSGPLGRCTSAETQVTWNEQGPQGQPGQPGQPRTPGKDGISPTVAQLSVGDSHCPAGGAAITDASGTTAYVCNGQNGADGQSFSGSFASRTGNSR
jgi:hypothetical protein